MSTGRWPMSTGRRRMATALLITGITAFTMPAAHAEPALPAQTTIAVTGTDRALYIRGPGQTNYANWGGQLIANPALAITNGVTHVIGVSTSGALYHRTATTTWSPLHPTQPYICTDISAAASDTTIYGACRGTNAILYTFSFPSASQTPTITTMTQRAGDSLSPTTIIGPPAVIIRNNQPEYIATSSKTYTSGGRTYNTYTYKGGVWQKNYSYCSGPPTAIANATRTYLACKYATNVINIETWYTSSAYPTGTTNIQHIRGLIQGTPSLAPTNNGTTAQLYVNGVNGAIYTKALNATTQNTTSPWTLISGASTFGVSAAYT